MLIWGVAILMSPRLRLTTSGKQRDKSASSSTSTSSIFSYALLIFLIVMTIKEVGSTSITTFMTTYLVKGRNVSESIASLIFGLGPFVGIVASLVAGYLGIRVGAKKALSWAILGSAASLCVLGLLTDTTSLTLTFIVYAFFSYAVWSPTSALMAEITPAATRGLGYSILFFVQGLMTSATPVLAAGVIELLGIWVIFPFSVAFLIASVFVLELLGHPLRRRAPS